MRKNKDVTKSVTIDSSILSLIPKLIYKWIINENVKANILKLLERNVDKSGVGKYFLMRTKEALPVKNIGKFKFKCKSSKH